MQDPQASPAPDLLERDFSSSKPGARLVGDITYLRTWAGWAYLSVVICTHRRSPSGCARARGVVADAAPEQAKVTTATTSLRSPCSGLT